MPGPGPIFPSSEYVAKQIADTRETLRRSRKLLAQSTPGTFAGSKTQEPFPEGDDLDARMASWMAAKEQPPK